LPIEIVDCDCRLLIGSIARLLHNSRVSVPRFYVPDLDPAGREARLSKDEANHLTRVMRLGPGDEVAVFDGRGHEFRARVIVASRGTASVELLDAISSAPEARVPITLVQAVLKGDKMDAVIRDATMMGVAAIEPIVTSRTIARVQRAENDRWVRVSVASAKQCRRAVVPLIASPRPFENWLAESAHGLRLMLVEPSATAAEICSLHFLENHAAGSLALIVGPEGGWTLEERTEADAAGCMAVTLGGLTLRADAVAVAALAIARFALKDL
jgi:16S rRNA (uracil1498-N3)-methyltransferase